MDTEEISTYGRVTKGVRLMRLGDGVKVVTVARVDKEEDGEDEAEPIPSAETGQEE